MACNTTMNKESFETIDLYNCNLCNCMHWCKKYKCKSWGWEKQKCTDHHLEFYSTGKVKKACTYFKIQIPVNTCKKKDIKNNKPKISTNKHLNYDLFCADAINLAGFESVTTIEDDFLKDCQNIESIDLSSLKNVTNIGEGFLCKCNSLKSIDLSPLNNVTSIGDYFLWDCDELENINLSPLKNVTSIGDDFINYCYKLKTIDVSPLSNVEIIGTNFLSECPVCEVNLSPLANVKKISDEQSLMEVVDNKIYTYY